MTIDLTNVDIKAAFHLTMKSQLGFPDWYGEDWDAFSNLARVTLR